MASCDNARVLQFGTGVLLRGYFDWMLQRTKQICLWEGTALGVKLTPNGEFALAQDPVFQHVTRGVLQGAIVNESMSIDVVSRWINPYEEDGMKEFLASAAIPTMDIVVSNSTEAGLVYEATPRPEGSACPGSFPAKLLMWLYARFKADANLRVTVLPFELLENNGPLLKEIILRHSQDWSLGADFQSWVDDHCDFRSTLVDRIVTKPGPSDHPLQTISEPYHLLVIEGDSSLEERLPLKAAGINVVYTDNLALYRTRKVSVLNGAHHTIVFLGLAAGKGNVLECTQDEALSAFLEKVIKEEVLPILDGDAEELLQYASAILERFRNPFLDHRLDAIAMNSAAKVQSRLLPSIHAHHAKHGLLPAGLALAVGAFLAYDGSVQGCEPGPVLNACEGIPGLREAAEEAAAKLRSSSPYIVMRDAQSS